MQVFRQISHLAVQRQVRAFPAPLVRHVVAARFSTKEEAPGANGENNAEAAEPAAPQDATEALKAQVKELTDKVLRSYAEEENVRRIAKRDVELAREYANTSFAKALLEVADNLEMALAAVPAEKRGDPALKSLLTGVEMTDKQLQKVFREFKVVQYGQVGDKFDPMLHDALFQVPDATKEEGTISQVLKTGYKLKDRVIRAAQVGTAKQP